MNVDNFKYYPTSLGDKRSDVTDRACDWAPREMLIEMLRRIDSGEDIEVAVICYRQRVGDAVKTSFVAAGGKTVVDLWATVAHAEFLMHCSDK